MKTHYDALDVAQNATTAEIKKAWRKLAFDCHPDRAEVRGLSGPAEGKRAARFKRGMLAWETLGDADKRSAYDRELVEEATRPNPRGRSRRRQAYGDRAWQGAQRAWEAMHAERLRQAQVRQWQAQRRREAQQQRRAAERERAVEQHEAWEEAHEAYLQRIVDNLRCDIAAFFLDDHWS